tara:strand:+ start:12577 stop:12996 length:420 start_codon:yes stop_codon:yes gene_type:complete
MSTNEYFQLSIPKDITVEVPLNFDSEKPGFTTLSEEQIVEVINYNLKSILLTSPGERLDSTFGVGLRNYLFENNLQNTSAIIQSNISNQISKYLPWLSSYNVNVETFYDGQGLNISIAYEIKNPTIIEYFDLSLSLADL